MSSKAYVWRGGRCPSGKETRSQRVYLAEWRKFARRMEKLTGLTCTGMDPSISLSLIKDKKFVDGRSIQCPLWFCKRLLGEE